MAIYIQPFKKFVAPTDTATGPSTQTTGVPAQPIVDVIKSFKERTSNIPGGYQFVKPTAARGVPSFITPPKTARFVSMPEQFGGGQYTYNPENTGQLIKSYVPTGSTLAQRGGLSSNLVEVDHIVPLWAGGNNTDENKQVLNYIDHDIKTKVDAIARTLYYDDNLNINAARGLLVDFKNKDVSNIILDSEGNLSSDKEEAVNIARAKLAEWKKENEKPVKVSFGDVWEQVKKGGGSAWGESNLLGQFAKGFEKELTLGYAPVEPINKALLNKPSDYTAAAIARGAGSLFGGLVPFTAGAKVLGLVGKAAKATGLIKVAETVTNLTKAEQLAQRMKASSLLAKTTAWLQGSESTIVKGIIKESPKIGAHIARNVPLFGTISALSKQEERTFGSTVTSFLSGASSGALFGVFGGYKPTLVKKMVPFWVSMYTLGTIEGATPGEAAMNATIATGFLGLGRFGWNRRAEMQVRKTAVDEWVKLGGTRSVAEKSIPVNTMFETTTKPEKVPFYKLATSKDKVRPLTEEEFPKKSAKKLNDEGNKMIDALKDKNLPEEQFLAERQKIITLQRYIRNGGLPEIKKLREEIADVKSLIKKANDIKGFMNKKGLSLPKNVSNFVTNNADKIFSKDIKLTPDESVINELKNRKLTTGSTSVSSTVANAEINKDARDFISDGGLKQKGKTRVIIVRDPQEAAYLTEINSRRPIEERDMYPQNYIKVVGYIPGQTQSGKNFYWLANVPSPEYIKSANIKRGLSGIRSLDESFNKNTLADSMENAGTSLLTATLDGGIAKKSKNPWFTVEVTNQDYVTSKTLIKESFQDITSKIKEFSKKRASEVIVKGTTSDKKMYFTAPIIAFEERMKIAILEKDLSAIKKAFKDIDVFGFKVTDADAKLFLDKKANLGKLLDVIEKYKNQTIESKRIYDGTVGEFLKNLTPEARKVINGLSLMEGVRDVSSKEFEALAKISTLPKIGEESVAKKSRVVRKIVPEEKISTPEETIKEEDKDLLFNDERQPADNVQEPITTDVSDITPQRITVKSFSTVSSKGVHQASETVLDNKINQLVREGNYAKAKEINKQKSRLTPKALRIKARAVYEANGKDMEKSYDVFKKDYVDFLKKDMDISNPVDTYKKSQEFYRYFYKLVEGKNRPTFFVRGGKAIEGKDVNDGKFSSDLDNLINEQTILSNKDGEVKLVYLDKAETIKDKKNISVTEIVDAMKNNNIIPLGAQGNDASTIYGLKVKDGDVDILVKKYDSNPSKYLVEGETITGPNEKYTKAIKVISQDVFKLPKETKQTFYDKRSKIIDNKDYNPLKNKLLDITVLTVKDKTLGNTKAIDWDKLRGNQSDIDALKKSPVDAGTIFITQETADVIGKNMGLTFKPTNLKPTMHFSYVRDGKVTNVTVKGNFVVARGKARTVVENELGRSIKPYELIAFNDNIKSGEVETDAPSYAFKNIKSEALRIKYTNDPKNKKGNSFGPSTVGKLSSADDPNNALTDMWNKPAKEFIDFVNEIQGATGAGKLLEVLDKYKITPEEVFGGESRKDIKARLKNGAGIKSLNKQIDGYITSYWNNELMSGKKVLPGVHLVGVSDVGGLIKKGEYLKESGISALINPMDAEKIENTGKIILTRNPVTGKDAIVPLEYATSKDVGVGQIILNHGTTRIKVKGDFDFDSYGLQKVGGTDGIPLKFYESFRNQQSSIGGYVTEALVKYEPNEVFLNYDNVVKLMEASIRSGDAVSQSSTANRIMASVKDANPTIKISAGKGNSPRNYEISFGDKVWKKGTIGGNTKDSNYYDEKTLKVNFGTKEQEIGTNLIQMATDAKGSKNLIKILGKNGSADEYLNRIYWNTDDPAALKVINNLNKEFQKPFNLSKPIKLSDLNKTEQAKKSSTEKLSEKLNEIQDFFDVIEAGGGELSPFFKILRKFKGFAPIKPLSMKATYEADTSASALLQETYNKKYGYTVESPDGQRLSLGEVGKLPVNRKIPPKIKFKILNTPENKSINRSKINTFIEEFEKLTDWYANYTDKLNTPLEKSITVGKLNEEYKLKIDTLDGNTVRKAILDKIKDLANNNTIDLNPAEQEAVAFWLATSPSANMKVPLTYIGKNARWGENMVFRLDDTINKLNPAVAKKYYEGFEGVETESLRVSDQKIQEPSNVIRKTPEVKIIKETLYKKLPKEIADSVTVVHDEVNIPQGADLSTTSHLESVGIIDSFAKAYAVKNQSKIKIGEIKSEADLNKIASQRLTQRQTPGTYPDIAREMERAGDSQLEHNFTEWNKALNDNKDYPVYFKEMMMDVPTEGIRGTRDNPYVTPVSRIALRATYDYLQQHPSEIQAARKVYRRMLLEQTTEAVAHEPSASGKGHWIHIPKTREIKGDYTVYGEYGTSPESSYKTLREAVDSLKDYGDMKDIGENKKYRIKDSEQQDIPYPVTESSIENINAQFKINIEMLKRLSPETWCTSSWAAEDYVRNYDNYLLVVDGKTVAGVEVITRLEPLLREWNNKTVREVNDVTSIANNGVASIDYLDDTLAFLEKHNIDYYDAESITDAQKYKAKGKTDKDIQKIQEDEEGWGAGEEGWGAGDLEEPMRIHEMTPDQWTPEIALEEVTNDAFALQFVPKELITPEIARIAVNRTANTLQYVPKELITPELILTTVRKPNENNLQFVPKELITPEIARIAIENNTDSLRYVPEELRTPELLRRLSKFEANQYTEGFNINPPERPVAPFPRISRILSSKTSQGKIEGYYDPSTDKAILLAKNLTPERATEVALHEITHRGMVRTAKELGGFVELHKILKSAETELMKASPELLKRTGHNSIDELVADYGFDIKTKEGEAKLLSELTARWSEKFANKPPETWWNEFIGKLREWIKTFMGKDLDEKGVDDLVSGFIKRGSNPVSVETVNKWSNLRKNVTAPKPKSSNVIRKTPINIDKGVKGGGNWADGQGGGGLKSNYSSLVKNIKSPAKKDYSSLIKRINNQ